MKRKNFASFAIMLTFVGLAMAGFSYLPKHTDVANARPNVVIIMADDMGWSDIGSYGSEIPTPNLDTLANNGIRFSQFYNNARCCPTRASLLTGLYSHQAGIGQMSEDPEKPEEYHWGTPGYQGFLNRHCVTIAEALKTNGYHTYMTGKWHVGMQGKEKWPLQRGFDRYYGILSGAASYLKPQGLRGLTVDNKNLDPPTDPDYYTTDAFTDYAIRFIKEQKDEKPFLLYLAFNAPHWPLHAKPSDIAKFKGKYDAGWDVMRQHRLARQEKMGLFKPGTRVSARDHRVRPWAALSIGEKDSTAYRMSVYAAQVSALDQNVGKLITELKRRGQFDNTLILFLSDNGACAETYDELGSRPMAKINDSSIWGPVSYGIGWANNSNAPLFEYKVKPYEGGMRAPFIAHYPNGIDTQRGKITHVKGHIIDLMPTILDLTGTTYPKTFHDGQTITPLSGRSLLPTLKTGTQPDPTYMYWEHEWYGAVRKGDWKAIYHLKKGTWELYNIMTDPIEAHDEAQKQPVLLADLQQHWRQWANTHNVFPKRAE